jgi:hypothetical protein
MEREELIKLIESDKSMEEIIVELVSQKFWELFWEDIEAQAEITLNGTGEDEPVGILYLKDE